MVFLAGLPAVPFFFGVMPITHAPLALSVTLQVTLPPDAVQVPRIVFFLKVAAME